MAWTVPGQHDLPLHNYDDIKKSAYWTLVQAGLFHDLKPGEKKDTELFTLHGFPWESELVSNLSPKHTFGFDIAVIHAYVWIKDHAFPNAPDMYRLKCYRKRLRGYDLAIFGDNHKGFLNRKRSKCTILNCGTLMRRTSDEIEYNPCVGLLYRDGTVKRYELDCSDDVYMNIKTARQVESVLNMCDFIGDLNGLDEEEFYNYPDLIKDVLKRRSVNKKTSRLVIQAMERKRDE